MVIPNFNTTLENLLREFFRVIARVFRRDGIEHAFCKPSAGVCWRDNTELQEAILTIRMAAIPGDDYEAVAARIEREAKKYREFLQNPTPIGKISLNVKQLPSDSDDSVFTCSKYQVHDPAKGLASVFYNVQRSSRQVLEFVVHDEKDRPLFPIVRTYSDWIGRKEFKLGLDRTFHLNIIEGNTPDVVRVRAGFTPIEQDAREASHVRDELEIEPIAAPVAANEVVNSLPSLRSVFQGRRLAFALGVEYLVISLGCFFLTWAIIANRSTPANSAKPSPPNASAPGIQDKGSEQITHNLNFSDRPRSLGMGGQAMEETTNRPGRRPVSDKKSQLLAHHQQKTIRMAAIVGLGIVTDGSSCDVTGSGCQELLSSFHETIKTDLSRLNLLASPANQTEIKHGYAKLVLSYKPVDDCFGHVYVTLFDQNGLLWGEEKDCFAFGNGDAEYFVKASSESIVNKLVLEIKSAKEKTNSVTNEKEGEPLEKGREGTSG